MIFDIQPVPHLHAIPINGSARFSMALAIISGISFSGNWYGP